MTDYEPWAGTGYANSVSKGIALSKAGWHSIDRNGDWWTKNGKIAYPTNIAYKKEFK